MTVLYSDRTLPISKNASKPELSNGLVLAWDFTGIGSLAEGEPWIYQGAVTPTLVKSGTQTRETLAGEPGMVPAASSLYEYTNLENYGLQFGTGDFTIAIRISTASVLPTSAQIRSMLRISGSAGNALSLNFIENPDIGWYVTAVGSAAIPLGATKTATFFPTDTNVVVFVQRIAGVVRVLTANATTQSVPKVRYDTSAAASGPVDATWAATARINTHLAGVVTTPALQSIRVWNVGLSDVALAAITNDYWAVESNAAVADSITITSPSSGASISTTSVISGTYIGTAPSGVEVQHGTGAWTAGTAMSISGGVWSGTFILPANSANDLKARESNNVAVISAAVANVLVATPASSITFTYPSSQTSAKAFRMFQRDGANAASVRVSGTYIGSPISLQYRWAGGTWGTLVTAPSGGVFDTTVVLQGLNQGPLEVRFADETDVFASLDAVGVGDVYIVAGQSNHVGGGFGDYVPPSPPVSNPGWKGTIYAKNGSWRENVETPALTFSSTEGAVYGVQGSGSTSGSYFGRLATLCMASGIPVAFVPCAIGSTALSQWAPSASTSTLYGSTAATATTIGAHKGVLWWQGEADAIADRPQAPHETDLNAIIDSWFAEFGTPWVIMNINSGGTGGGFTAIHAAIANVAATNTHVAGYADMNGAFSGLHYAATTEINNVATRAFNALEYVSDTESPVLDGALTVSDTTTSGGMLSWPAAIDDRAVVGYEYSTNGGTSYTSVGLSLSAVLTGLIASTAYPCRVRAFDAAGNRSTPITATLTTQADVIPTRSVSLVLGDEDGPTANLSGVMVSFHIATGPHNTGLAVYQSNTETTDTNGTVAFSFQSDSVSAGTVGLVSVLTPDERHYLGKVVVS